MESLFRLPWRSLLAVIAFAAIAPGLAPAQDADVARLREPIILDMTWLVQPGDNPAYAQQNFDDSKWMRFDPRTPITGILPTPYPGVVWYRLHLKTDPASTGLALSEWNISRAFEIYVNGERLVQSGKIAPFVPYSSTARILARIPDRLVATGSAVIALRVHISSTEWASGQDPGFYASNLKIGQYGTLYRDNWLSVIGENAFGWVDRILLICLGFVALVLLTSQRRHYEYLWIFAVGVLTLLEFPFPFIAVFRNLPTTWELLTDLLRIASPFLWLSLYFSFLHLRVGWRWSVFLLLAGFMNAFSGAQGLYFTVPNWLRLFANLPFIMLLSVFIPILLAKHLKRGNREAGILLVPCVLFSLYIYIEIALGTMFQFPSWRATALRGLNLIDRYPAGPFAISLDSVSGILCTLSLAIIMIRRSSTMSRRQAQIESELEAAQQVQQVLVPERLCLLPGFQIESVYQPAQQVGGDFFQVLPAGDGGMLLVVGDVAGKGLPAAMLVSVLVGSIRAIAEYTCVPAEILSNLNDRLLGRAGGGFSTATAAHISAEGSVSLANAGHLSPYLDGEEIAIPGALPLGVVPDAKYETITFNLPPGSRLTFYSDGVVEAQNQKGELFGFERSRELSTQPASVIAKSAECFGQQDDITVVTIQRQASFIEANRDRPAFEPAGQWAPTAAHLN
jgi:hypothetical protein